MFEASSQDRTIVQFTGAQAGTGSLTCISGQPSEPVNCSISIRDDGISIRDDGRYTNTASMAVMVAVHQDA